MSNSTLTFELFIDDDRYSVPTLQLLIADGEVEAGAMAEDFLRANLHHLGVELWTGGRRIMGLGSYAAAGRGGFAGPKATVISAE